MNHRTRSFVALVIVFAGLAAGVLWWQALRSQAQLREQVLLQAAQRSLHLADAMAGQVQAQLNLMDVSLKDLREHWQGLTGVGTAREGLGHASLKRLPGHV